MTPSRDYAAMSDPRANPQFRRLWTEPPKKMRGKRRQRIRAWRDGLEYVEQKAGRA